MSKKAEAFVEPAIDGGVSLTGDLAQERVVDLSDFAEAPGGALPRGWYAAEVIEGYATRNGKQFVTSDTVSKNGDSRNLRLCIKVSTATEPHNLQEVLNYRPSDFTPERLAFIKEMRSEFKGTKGRWANADVQRSSLAVASLGQVGKAMSIGTPLTAEGNIKAGAFVGKKLDVRVSIDDNGYNVVTGYAAIHTYTKAARENGTTTSA